MRSLITNECRIYTIFHVLLGSVCFSVGLALAADVIVQASRPPWTTEIYAGRHGRKHQMRRRPQTPNAPTAANAECTDGRKRQMLRRPQQQPQPQQQKPPQQPQQPPQQQGNFSEGGITTDCAKRRGEVVCSGCRCDWWDVGFAAALLLFLGGGTAFGMLNQQWEFSAALLFAESSLATAGLVGPTGTRDSTMWFVTFWVLFGVPLYGGAIMHFSGKVVARSQMHRFKELISRPMSIEGLALAERFSGEGRMVGWAELMLVMLVKVGDLKVAQVEQLFDRFALMDVDSDGVLSLEELHLSLAFDTFDQTGDGVLTRNEFASMYTKLCVAFPALASVDVGGPVGRCDQIFDQIDGDSNNVLTHDEVLPWLVQATSAAELELEEQCERTNK
jgi:Ca2+-binding EF-hand superfamily protein